MSSQKRTQEVLMRLAILSDIHGNPLALDAVLADIQSQGEVDAYWVLGDFAALGYDPVTGDFHKYLVLAQQCRA